MFNIPKKCQDYKYRDDITCEAGLFCKRTLFEKPNETITADNIKFDEELFIGIREDEFNKILKFRDLTKTETISDAVMLAIKIATFTLTYVREKGSGVK